MLKIVIYLSAKVDEDCKKSLEYVFASIHKSESRHKGQWMTLLSNQQMCPVSTRAEIENIGLFLRTKLFPFFNYL